MVKLKHFDGTEFLCHCGCGLGVDEMDKAFLVQLDEAREIAGIPFNLNRAISCIPHNYVVGGVEDSSHLLGYAADIDCNDSVSRFKIVKALLAVGITRIGIYKRGGNTFIHCDVDPLKAQEVIW